MKKELNGETWKPIPGYEGYEASTNQQIRSIDRVVKHNYGGDYIKKGRILTQHINSNGYKSCGMCIAGRTITRVAHRLIALAFISNPENKATVNHKNGNKLDNSIENLEWATHSENNQHAWDIGLNGNYERTVAQQTLYIEAAKRPVTAKDFRTGDIKEFTSVSECANSLNVTQSCISQALIRGTRVQRKYEIKYAA